jgi:uncharacterized protein (TIGR03067 family)
MEDQTIRGMWKLIDVTKSEVTGANFDETYHFADERFLFICNQGELSKRRYRVNANAIPAEIDIGDSLGIYKLVEGKLFICRASPGQARPQSFDNESVEIFEYLGQGPADWKAQYKQKRRGQLERTIEDFERRGHDIDSERF